MANPNDRQREIERQMAVAEAKIKSESGKQPKAAPVVTRILPATNESGTHDGGGLFDRVGGFFHRISVDVEQRRQTFYAEPVIEAIAEEILVAPPTRWGGMRATFSHAAHATMHNRAIRALTDNRVVHAVTHSRVWKPFGVIPHALHYYRYPLGKPGDRQNAYTHVTINADFYVQSASSAVLRPVGRLLLRGLGNLGELIQDHSHEKMQALKKSHPSLYYGIKTTGLMWNWGGKQTLGAFYNHVCCEKAPNGERYFSPLQIANSAAFVGLLWGTSIVAPIVINPVVAAASPFYWKMTEHSYHNVIVMDKTGPDAEETFIVSVASKDELEQAKRRRADGEDVDDDEIGRRLDIEQNWIYGINNPYAIAAMIPKIGHCDKIDAAGWFFRTPKIKIGGLKLIRAHVWLAPEIVGTQGCKPYTNEQQGRLPSIDMRVATQPNQVAVHEIFKPFTTPDNFYQIPANVNRVRFSGLRASL